MSAYLFFNCGIFLVNFGRDFIKIPNKWLLHFFIFFIYDYCEIESRPGTTVPAIAILSITIFYLIVKST